MLAGETKTQAIDDEKPRARRVAGERASLREPSRIIVR